MGLSVRGRGGTCLPPRPALPAWTPDTSLPKFQAKQGSVESTVTQGEPMAEHAPCFHPRVRKARPQRCCSHSGRGTIGKHSLSCAHQTENDGGDPPSLLSVCLSLPRPCPLLLKQGGSRSQVTVPLQQTRKPKLADRHNCCLHTSNRPAHAGRSLPCKNRAPGFRMDTKPGVGPCVTLQAACPQGQPCRTAFLGRETLVFPKLGTPGKAAPRKTMEPLQLCLRLQL